MYASCSLGNSTSRNYYSVALAHAEMPSSWGFIKQKIYLGVGLFVVHEQRKEGKSLKKKHFAIDN